MAEPFTARLTLEQREACAIANLDRRMSAKAVERAAKAGQLAGKAGGTLEPFTISASYVADLSSSERRRRRGEGSKLADMEHRDAIEALRRRFIGTADAVLTVEEKKKPEKRDLNRVRECIRCVREAAALPGPRDPRPAPPSEGIGSSQGHGKRPGATRNGLAGAILMEHRRVPQNAEGPAAEGGPNGGTGQDP